MASPKAVLTSKDMTEIDQVFDSVPVHETFTTDQIVDWLLEVLELVHDESGDELIALGDDDATPASPRKTAGSPSKATKQEVDALAKDLEKTTVDEEKAAVLAMFTKRFNGGKDHLFCKDGLVFWEPSDLASNPHIDYFEGPTLIEKVAAVALPTGFVYITPYATTGDDGSSIPVEDFKIWGAVPWSEVETYIDSPDFRDLMKDFITDKREGSRAVNIDKIVESYDKQQEE